MRVPAEARQLMPMTLKNSHGAGALASCSGPLAAGQGESRACREGWWGDLEDTRPVKKGAPAPADFRS